MRFAPKTEKEVSEEGLLKPGVYDFEVVETDDKPSAKGNEMITLKLHIFADDGAPRIIFDYLLESIAYKLRHACDACGLLDKYEAGNVEASDFMGKTGKVKVKIDKDKTGQYSDKNGIADYIKRENLVSNGKQPPAGMLGEGTPLNDEIPF